MIETIRIQQYFQRYHIMPASKKMKEDQNQESNDPVQDSSDQEQSDSIDSKELQQMEQFNSDQSWAELDELEQHMFNGSHEEDSPTDTQPKKPKKKDQQAAKILEIQQQEKWLQKFRSTKLKQYYDPFKPQTLTINTKKVIKTLQEGINNSVSINPVTKSMGIKPVKILNKWKVNQQFQWFINYIQNGQIPQCLVIQFENFMKGKTEWQDNNQKQQ